MSIGNEIHDLARDLWGFDRSLTGDGVRNTLKTIKKHLPSLKVYEVPSGKQVFDWIVPKEWRVSAAWIITPDGKKICDFKSNNLHLVGYSTPVNVKLSLTELQNHLYSLPEQPTAIPYITSYYEERWGFCLSQIERDHLIEGEYQILIDSELFDGSLTYGEVVLPGVSEKEVFLSTYICHPSMANNELSGPTVTTFIVKWLQNLPSRKYTYRIVFIPETIGSITYLSQNLEHLQKNVIAGFNVSCIGDDRAYSYMPSRKGNTLSDKVALHVLKEIDQNFIRYNWSDRGSDERQYCAPLVDLPIAGILRSKWLAYEEYHTSLDDLVRVVTPSGLEGGYNALKKALEAVEHHCYPVITVLCEPQLGKRDLYPSISTKNKHKDTVLMTNILTWSDGTNSLLDIAVLCSVPVWKTYPVIDTLVENGLLHLRDNATC
jgi:aminopeptidase-like protein